MSVAMEDVGSEVADLVRRVLSTAEKPMSAAQILKAIPKSARPKPDELQAILQQEGFWKYGAVGGKPTYLDREPRPHVQRHIRQVLGGEPLTRTEVIAAVKRQKILTGLSKKQLEADFDDLVRNGEVHTLVPYVGKKAKLFSLTPARPRDYLRQALKAPLAKVATTLGVGVDTFVNVMPDVVALIQDDLIAEAAKKASRKPRTPKGGTSVVKPPAPPADERNLAQELMEAISDVNPRAEHGDLVLISDLRDRRHWHVDKATFDAELLKLAATGRIALHGFDRAAAVSDAEREAMLRDEADRYYNAVSIRRAP